MDKLVAKQSGHDIEMVWLDDGIEFFVAGADRDKYAHVIVNTNKSVYDEANQDPGWNPAIEVGLHKRADAWSLELAIPWADLATAGVPRSDVMAINFCRSRFAGPEDSPHSAWSATYGGFHTPSRFGVALPQVGPVALAGVGVPSLWGEQTVRVTLCNITEKPLQVHARLRGWGAKVVAIGPAATADVEFPVNLTRPGKRTMTLSWGAEGDLWRETKLVAGIPEPLAFDGTGGFATAGGTLELPIAVSAANSQAYRVRVQVSGASGKQTVMLNAAPGQERELSVSADGRVTVAASLVDSNGRPLTVPVETSLFALSQ